MAADNDKKMFFIVVGGLAFLIYRDEQQKQKKKEYDLLLQRYTAQLGQRGTVPDILTGTQPMPDNKQTPPPIIPAAKWKTPAAGMPWEPLFLSASEAYRLPPGLLSRVAYQESRYNPRAFNRKSGASGMMQIIPKWHPDVKNPYDPAEAIPYAAKYLRDLFVQFKTWKKAVAAYNWGPGNLSTLIQQRGTNWLAYTPSETYNYVNGVANDTGIN